MKSHIEKIGSLKECNDTKKLDNQPDFFKMINLKIIKNMQDYVNQTAASV